VSPRPTTRLRRLLAEPGILVAPGAYDCLSARLIEETGFPAVYTTGAGVAVARHGVPDLGLVTQTEMAAAATAIAASVRVPVIADADTGYGSTRNVERTVSAYENAGVAGLQLEDQEFPKRCGHLDDKRVIDAGEMAEKIRAACEARRDPDFVIVARTDALATDGLDEAIRRSERYAAAGADVLFVEALRTREEAERVAAAAGRPLLYNVVESGKSPLLPVADLERIGFKIAIFPATALLSAMAAIRSSLAELRTLGTTAHLVGTLPTIVECFELVGLREILAREARRRS
jgi:carboxyvinyl-carboxyphosphonate phosphorylmutase